MSNKSKKEIKKALNKYIKKELILEDKLEEYAAIGVHSRELEKEYDRVLSHSIALQEELFQRFGEFVPRVDEEHMNKDLLAILEQMPSDLVVENILTGEVEVIKGREKKIKEKTIEELHKELNELIERAEKLDRNTYAIRELGRYNRELENEYDIVRNRIAFIHEQLYQQTGKVDMEKLTWYMPPEALFKMWERIQNID